MDHIAPNCPNKPKNQPVVDPKGEVKKTVTCFECGGPHYRRDCPKVKVKKPDGGRKVTSKYMAADEEQEEEEFLSVTDGQEEAQEESQTDLRAVRLAKEMVRSLIDPEVNEASLNTLVATMEAKKDSDELIILDGGATHDVYVCPRQDAIKGIPKKVHLAHGTRDAFVDTDEGRVTFLTRRRQIRSRRHRRF